MALFLLVGIASCAASTPVDQGAREGLLVLAQHVEDGDRARARGLDELRARLDELRGALEKVRAVVERHADESSARFSRTAADLSTLQGRVDEVWRQLEEVQHVLSRVPTTDSRAVRLSSAADADALWTDANRELNADRFDEARRLLRSFLEQHPNHERGPQVRFQLGESYFRQDRYSSAIDEYQRVLDQNAQGPQAEDARFKIGLSYLALKSCSNARAVLSQLLASAPRTRHEQVIRAKIAEIDRGLRNKRVCLN